MAKIAKDTKPKKDPGVKRKASPYNIFMKEELARVKKEDDKITHKEAFKVAASRWKAHKAKTESK